MMNFLFLTIVVFATFAGVASAPHIIETDEKSSNASQTQNCSPDNNVGGQPGHHFGSHQQCGWSGFMKACDPDPEMCKNLQCAYYNVLSEEWECENLSFGALDGTPCGPYKAECSNGECRISDDITVKEVEH